MTRDAFLTIKFLDVSPKAINVNEAFEAKLQKKTHKRFANRKYKLTILVKDRIKKM